MASYADVKSKFPGTTDDQIADAALKYLGQRNRAKGQGARRRAEMKEFRDWKASKAGATKA